MTIPESEIESRAEALDNLCRQKAGELGLDPVTATNLVLLHKVAELELRFEAAAKDDVIHCECGGILEQVMLAEFDMSDFGIPRVLHDALGYRCSGCGGVTVGGEVINAAMDAMKQERNDQLVPLSFANYKELVSAVEALHPGSTGDEFDRAHGVVAKIRMTAAASWVGENQEHATKAGGR